MVRCLSRPLGVVLLAALAATPVARTLCAWQCSADTPAHAAAPALADHAGSHCAQPASDRGQAAHSVTGTPDCSGCDADFPTLRATLRADAGAVVAGPVDWSMATRSIEVRAAAARAASPLTGSPPLRAPYPLRI